MECVGKRKRGKKNRYKKSRKEEEKKKEKGVQAILKEWKKRIEEKR